MEICILNAQLPLHEAALQVIFMAVTRKLTGEPKKSFQIQARAPFWRGIVWVGCYSFNAAEILTIPSMMITYILKRVSHLDTQTSMN